MEKQKFTAWNISRIIVANEMWKSVIFYVDEDNTEILKVTGIKDPGDKEIEIEVEVEEMWKLRKVLSDSSEYVYTEEYENV